MRPHRYAVGRRTRSFSGERTILDSGYTVIIMSIRREKRWIELGLLSFFFCSDVRPCNHLIRYIFCKSDAQTPARTNCLDALSHLFSAYSPHSYSCYDPVLGLTPRRQLPETHYMRTNLFDLQGVDRSIARGCTGRVL